MDNEYEDFGDHLVVKVTDAAIGIESGDEDARGRPVLRWLPRSVVEDGEDMEEGQEYEFRVKLWFLEREGLV